MIINLDKTVCKYGGVRVAEENSELKKEKKLEIESRVEALIKDVSFKKTHFVDIVSIVKKDGFVVEPREMDIETTGCLFVDENNTDSPKRSIWVNTVFKNPDNDDDVVFKKSRFITAHEYGHYILHGALTAHRDTYHRTEPMELEADYFARSILMPLNMFRTVYKVMCDFSKNDDAYVIEILSSFFNVTKSKVRKRIDDLKELCS